MAASGKRRWRPRGTIRNFVWDCDDQVVVKRSSKRMANCALAAVHSLAGIFHSFMVRFKTRKSSLRAASSVGKWPRALTARRSLAFSASMALVRDREMEVARQAEHAYEQFVGHWQPRGPGKRRTGAANEERR